MRKGRFQTANNTGLGDLSGPRRLHEQKWRAPPLSLSLAFLKQGPPGCQTDRFISKVQGVMVPVGSSIDMILKKATIANNEDNHGERAKLTLPMTTLMMTTTALTTATSTLL